MRSERSDARSNDSEARSTVLHTSLHMEGDTSSPISHKKEGFNSRQEHKCTFGVVVNVLWSYPTHMPLIGIRLYPLKSRLDIHRVEKKNIFPFKKWR
ncbi:hypothetical protein RHMOL_Rhmol08G0272800 [Rhododendron molle]|nr:hypothetical protein RHMOL_Rhmol08G0272800 [Rhododendron molle]